ncbi:MAG: 3'-5' exonuclease [Elusimicrobiota bacterium]
MAFSIPERLPDNNSQITKGERRVFEYLKKNLSEEYIVYYNIPVEGYYPDFIIIGPDLGVFVLEVKDWDFKSMKSINKETVSVEFNGTEEKRKNPIAQARDYVLKILTSVQKHNYLNSRKELFLRWGYGAIFPNVNKINLDILELSGISFCEALGSEFVFTGDDLKNNKLFETIKLKMKSKFGDFFIKQKDIDLIRSVIYPEIMLSEYFDENIIKIMDRKQESLAKSLRYGHHIIRGVAGSGKTVILLSRAKFLSSIYPNWKILLLCYNRSLAQFFKEKLNGFSKIEVRTYHSWCAKKLTEAKINLTKKDESSKEDYWENILPSKMLEAYSQNKISKGEYQAILVDEGQDFAHLWYKTILHALDKNTECLLIALDGSQTVYKRKVSWKSLGIQIIGRTKILKINYRNTKQILNSAYKLITDMDKKGEFVFEENPYYVIPEKILRDGPEPEFKKFDKFEEEKKYLLDWAKSKISKKKSEKIMILCLNRKDEYGVKSYLEKHGLKVSFASDANKNSDVVVSTIHSAKGLESDNVLLIDAHLLDKYQSGEAKRLLYIAMTRSREELCVCYLGECSIIIGESK